MAVVGGIAFALVLPVAAFADNLVNVDCGDGSPLSTAADAATLLSLQASVQGIVENPAGMSCSLSQSGPPDTPLQVGAPSSGKAFVVGGGRYGREFPDCPINFSLSGHLENNGAHGTQTATANNSDKTCNGEGHIKATVTCVAVSGNNAEVRGQITEQSGSLGSQFFPPGETVLVTDVQDNGNPSSGIPDTITQRVDATGTELNCTAPLGPQLFTVDNGNITVRD